MTFNTQRYTISHVGAQRFIGVVRFKMMGFQFSTNLTARIASIAVAFKHVKPLCSAFSALLPTFVMQYMSQNNRHTL